jgi:hypothetical protein
VEKEMNEEAHRIGKDLAKHLDQKIDLALQDYFDLCRRAHVEFDHSHALALTMLSYHIAVTALKVEATESEFVHMCRWHYHEMQKAVANAPAQQ